MTFNEWFEENKDRLTNELFEIQENVGLNMHEAENVKEILDVVWKAGRREAIDILTQLRSEIEELK